MHGRMQARDDDARSHNDALHFRVASKLSDTISPSAEVFAHISLQVDCDVLAACGKIPVTTATDTSSQE